MTKEQQRIAIAQACGWIKHPVVSGEPVSGVCLDFYTKDGYGTNNLPDYPSDLNAMHEAEGELTLDEQDKYAQILTEMFHGPGWSFALIHAGPEKRAEAFLKTLGLVDEPEPGIEWKVK